MQHREVIKAYSNKCSNILIQKFNFHYLRQAPKSFRPPADNSTAQSDDKRSGSRCANWVGMPELRCPPALATKPQRTILLKNKQTTKRRRCIKCIKLGGPIPMCMVSIKPKPLLWVMPALCKGVVRPRLVEKTVFPGALGEHSPKE